jgi:DNA-3-methyladenine glycosylase II
MPEVEFDITPPYDFALSLEFARCTRFEVRDSHGQNRLRRIMLIDGIPVFVEIGCDGGVERPRGILAWSYPEGGRVTRSAILQSARRVICADLNLGPFYRRLSAAARRTAVLRNFRGLKPILTPTVFESAAWAIMGQQVNLTFAFALKMRLVEEFGRRFSLNGTDFFLFPTPDIISRADTAELRRLQFSARKAEYLLGISKSVSCGDLDLEALAGQTYGSAVASLVSIRGVGSWSANYILMRGAGHLDCLPLGDSGLHRAVRKLYRLKTVPDNTRVENLARIFRPYRTLFTWYLWCYIMKGNTS